MLKFVYKERKVIPLALNINIKNARINKKMTQKELGNAIGVSHNAISDWESGNHKPDADTVMKLCRVLNVDANYMFDWKDEPLDDERQSLVDTLKKNNFLDKDDDLSEQDLKKMLAFAKANKEYIIEKK